MPRWFLRTSNKRSNGEAQKMGRGKEKRGQSQMRIITSPIEDYVYQLNKREDIKKKPKEPSTSFEDELKKAEKEQEDERNI